MEINLFVNDDERNSSIVNFCLQSKKLKFMFHELSSVKLFYSQKKLVILKEDFLIEDFKIRDQFKGLKSLKELRNIENS